VLRSQPSGLTKPRPLLEWNGLGWVAVTAKCSRQCEPETVDEFMTVHVYTDGAWLHIRVLPLPINFY